MRASDLGRPRLDASRTRIRHHYRTPYEHVFSASIYCLKQGDKEAAEVLARILQLLDEVEL